MGGEKLGKTPTKQLFELNMPGEVLLIDPLTGKARVQNDIDDRQGYLHALFLPDDSNTVGEEKKKKEEDEQDGPGGGFGGGDDFGN